jgi:prepilin-type N-terminal cleavage/methylation domain-containing protein
MIMMPRKNKMKREFTRGFSLIEVLVVVVIMGVVVGAVYALFTLSSRTYRNQDRVVVMQQNARGAIELLTQELRMAGYYNDPSPPPVAGQFGVLLATNTMIQFSQDLNGNRQLTGSDGNPEENEVVTYDWLPDQSLLRRDTNRVPGNANPVNPQNFADHITNFNLEYFRINNNALTAFIPDPTTLNQIRLVRITVQAESEVPGANPGGGLASYTLTTDVGLRNIAVRDR